MTEQAEAVVVEGVTINAEKPLVQRPFCELVKLVRQADLAPADAKDEDAEHEPPAR